MNPPTGTDVADMLVDHQLGRPFTGPEEWRPIWDQIGQELAAMPDGMIVDVPFDAVDADLEARAVAAAQVAEIDAAMQPTAVKVVCWRAADRTTFPPDGDPTPYIRHMYSERGYTTVNTDRDRVVVPEGGRLMAVVVPQGTPGLFDAETHELVLGRGLTFRVVSVAPNGTVKVVVNA